MIFMSVKNFHQRSPVHIYSRSFDLLLLDWCMAWPLKLIRESDLVCMQLLCLGAHAQARYMVVCLCVCVQTATAAQG